MASFIDVPAPALEGFLQSKGFVRAVRNREVVYEKQSKVNSVVWMLVYTSVSNGATSVRSAGKDAIRVCVVGRTTDGRSWGIGRFPAVPRVHSVESVLRRTEERLREAAKRATEWIAQNAERFPNRNPSKPQFPPPGSYAETARLQAGIMSGDQADSWKDQMLEDMSEDPPQGLFGGET